MRSDEFSSGMRELVETFGERHYPEVTKNRIWKIVNRITYGEFRGAIEKLCEDNTRAPTAGEIRRACGPALTRAKQAWIRSQLGALGAKCYWCDNTGHIFAVRNGTEHLQFQFRCTCKAATIVNPRALPLWDDRNHEREFTRVAFDTSEQEEERRLAQISRGVISRKPDPELGEWEKLAKEIIAGGLRESRT